MERLLCFICFLFLSGPIAVLTTALLVSLINYSSSEYKPESRVETINRELFSHIYNYRSAYDTKYEDLLEIINYKTWSSSEIKSLQNKFIEKVIEHNLNTSIDCVYEYTEEDFLNTKKLDYFMKELTELEYPVKVVEESGKPPKIVFRCEKKPERLIKLGSGSVCRWNGESCI